jgi:hypothetical protein
MAADNLPDDRAAAATLRAAAQVLGLPPRLLLKLPRGELRGMVRSARRRAERELTRANLRLDALVALGDLLAEKWR